MLDSTVHIHWLRGEAAVVEWLAATTAGLETVVTSAVAVSEVYAVAREHERSRYDEYFREMTVEPVTAAVGRAAGLLRSDLRARGLQLHLPDSLLAATALQIGVPIVTANVRDFRVAGLEVVPLGPHGTP